MKEKLNKKRLGKLDSSWVIKREEKLSRVQKYWYFLGNQGRCETIAVLRKGLDFAKDLVKAVVLPGDKVVDATAGNGHDTIFLARLVGERGRVWAFDIQEQALQRVNQRLQDEGLGERVKLLMQGHQEMDRFVSRPVGAIMFNLGYLPGGDHSIITCPDTSLAAVEKGLKLLKPGGIMTIMVYTGHPGGETEGKVLEDYCRNLPQEGFQVLKYRFLNQKNRPPYLLAIGKLR